MHLGRPASNTWGHCDVWGVVHRPAVLEEAVPDVASTAFDLRANVPTLLMVLPSTRRYTYIYIYHLQSNPHNPPLGRRKLILYRKGHRALCLNLRSLLLRQSGKRRLKNVDIHMYALARAPNTYLCMYCWCYDFYTNREDGGCRSQ